ncbi:MAG: MoaD/ThiS family protein [Gottschalkiaceae bacterium]|nr:MAG: MoaD/ThiS family protein [Gottschalkiaceae bacterium]
MIKIKFFGILRLKVEISSIEIESDRIDKLLNKIADIFKEITLDDLKKCIIYVNDTDISELKLYKTKLKDGDEIQIFSPAAGG